MLDFVAKSIELFPEIFVEPDPRSVGAVRNPVQTLAVEVSDRAPERSGRRIKFQGRYYTVGDTRWDRVAFMILYELFQVTVGDTFPNGQISETLPRNSSMTLFTD